MFDRQTEACDRLGSRVRRRIEGVRQDYDWPSQRTGSDILARNIGVAALLSNPGFPVEAVIRNPEILIQRLPWF